MLWKKIHPFSSILPRYASDFSICTIPLFPSPFAKEENQETTAAVSPGLHHQLAPYCLLFPSSIFFLALHLPLGIINICSIIKMNDSLPNLLKTARNLLMPTSLHRKVFANIFVFLLWRVEEELVSQLCHNRLEGNSCFFRAEFSTLVFDLNGRLFFLSNKRVENPESL